MLLLVAFVAATKPTKIAFGSCAGIFNNENPSLFKSIDAMEPDAFVWLGDVVYADQMVGPMVFQSSPPDEWRKMFADMKSKYGSRHPRLERTQPVLGLPRICRYETRDGKGCPQSATIGAAFMGSLPSRTGISQEKRSHPLVWKASPDAQESSGTIQANESFKGQRLAEWLVTSNSHLMPSAK